MESEKVKFSVSRVLFILLLFVVLPAGSWYYLLIWAIIAFFQEGSSWGARRELIKQKNEEVAKPQGGGQPQGYILHEHFSNNKG